MPQIEHARIQEQDIQPPFTDQFNECLFANPCHPLADYIPPHQDMAGKLRQIADGFQISRVFETALELDLFSYLTYPVTPQELSKIIGADPDLLQLVLGVLVNCGILEKNENYFSLDPKIRPFLLPDSPYYALFLMYSQAQRSYWDNLTACIRQKKSVLADQSQPRDNPDSVLHTGRTALLGRLQATMRIIKASVDGARVRKILDLGGGHGLFSISCAQEFPDAEITLIDRPEICPIASAQIRHAQMEDKVLILERNFHTSSLDGPYDLILDLGAFSGDKKQTQDWLYKIEDSLDDGGVYVKSAFTLNDCLTGPTMTLLFEIEEIISGRNQRHLTNREWKTHFSESGMVLLDIIDLSEETMAPLRILIAKKQIAYDYSVN